jgi:hypothetical protein
MVRAASTPGYSDGPFGGHGGGLASALRAGSGRGASERTATDAHARKVVIVVWPRGSNPRSKLSATGANPVQLKTALAALPAGLVNG